MIDLHCHLLPGLDDGAADLAASLKMARLFVEDGVSTVACTPHILPTVYDNTGPAIKNAVNELQKTLDKEGVRLRLVAGADVHIAPNLVESLASGKVLSLNDSRYLLFEPPHHVKPPRLEECVFGLLAAGYVPILTHPERLTWIEQRYDSMITLARSGVLMQITADSILGRFGSRARFWSERMLNEGLVHLIATDAHDPLRRAPRLSEARDAVAARWGDEEATKMVLLRPQAVIENRDPSQLALPEIRVSSAQPRRSILRRAIAGFRR